MSGLSLRALLEGSHLSLDLKGSGGSAASPASSQELAAPKLSSPTIASYDASRAYLNRTNIWDAPEVDGGAGFNLEYMDLEEFLQETGLESLDRTAIFPSSPASSVSSSASCDIPCRLQCTAAVGTPTAVLSPAAAVASPASPTAAVAIACPVSPPLAVAATAHLAAAIAVAAASSESAPAAAACSAEDAASTDTAAVANVPEKPSHSRMPSRTHAQRAAPVTDLTSVACIPGKEGFDPESHRFAPEELVPQPIIKKSRKVYVPDDLKDDRYWARRKKNNYAAKRSRDARRAKENQIIMRAAFLEQRNEELEEENGRLIEENKTLTSLVQAYKLRVGEK